MKAELKTQDSGYHPKYNLVGLQALRGICAILILIHHFGFQNTATDAFGDISVSIFFILLFFGDISYPLFIFHYPYLHFTRRIMTLNVIILSTILSVSAEIHHWNSRRGFRPIIETLPATGEALRLDATGATHLLATIPISIPTDDLSLTFRIANRHSHPTRRYSFTDTLGHRHSVLSPGWSILLRGVRGDSLRISLRSEESFEAGNGISSVRAVRLEVNGTHLPTPLTAFTTLLDPDGGWNSLHLTRQGDTFQLFGGTRRHELLLTFQSSSSPTSSISYEASPSSLLEIDWISLITSDPHPVSDRLTDISLDTLRQILTDSSDEMEGTWVIYDRSLEESRLRPGGDYRLLLAATGGGAYDIIYEGGALTCASSWTPGQLKGRLLPSDIPCVWNVIWYDAEHQPLDHDIRAQYDPTTSLLTIIYPYSSGQLRLYPIRL